MINDVVIILLGITVISILSYIFLPWGYKVIARSRFLARARSAGHVYITFDDGPAPHVTMQVLDILDKTGDKASFFVIGKLVEKYPEIVKEIVSRGHDIGYHSYHHTHGFKTGPIRSFKDNNPDALRKEKEFKTSLFRPPYGKMNIAGLLPIIKKKLKLVYWNLDPRDYAAQSSNAVASYILEHVQPGSVILFHDGGVNTEPARKTSVTPAALEQVLAGIRERGMKTGKVSELFQ